MNTIATKVRMKCAEIADKVSQSKVYKGAEKIAVGASTALMGVGLTAIDSFAVDGEVSNAITTAINVGDIIENASPFIESAIMVLCAVGGIKLGMRFLRGSFH